MDSLKEQLSDLMGAKRTVDRMEAQQRLNGRRYIVRVIDARDDWTKSVSTDSRSKDTVKLTASKAGAHRYESLKQAVLMRNQLNKQDHVKSAWIIFE